MNDDKVVNKKVRNGYNKNNNNRNNFKDYNRNNKKQNFNYKREEKKEEVVKKDSSNNILAKYRFNLIEVIIIMIITILFGLFVGGIIAYTKTDKKEVNCSDIREDMTDFVSVYDDMVNEFYEDVDRDKLIQSAIKGMLSALNDPYSAFLDSDEAQSLDDELNGAFIGIGVEIVSINNSLPEVTDVFDDSPAFRAGVLSGDILYKVNGKDLTGLTNDEISGMIKTDKKGEKINLTFVRNGEEIDIELERDWIEIKSVTSYYSTLNDKNIGVIVVSNFARNTFDQFKSEYKKLKEDNNIEGLIVDVRNNSGGYLSAARDMASLFLDKDSVVYQKDTKGKKEKFVTSVDKEIDIPVVVVTNELTASASEVFAAALKENLDIYVIGTKTYGKGSIQKLTELSDGSYVKYTVQTWLTPLGNVIEGFGITPDIEVLQRDEYYLNPSLENDAQIQAALNMLRK